MKLKRTFCLLLALLLTLALALPAAAADGTRSYAREEAMAYALKALGLFRGYSDADPGLADAPSRAQALVMMLRLMGLEQTALDEPREHPFGDTAAYAWADPYIAYAYEAGLTKGQYEATADTPALFGGDADADARVYLTFVLRALGYTEGADGDFRWDSPVSLAQAVGIAPDYVRFSDFRRADVVTVSYAALGAKMKDSTQTLAESLLERGVLTQALLDAYYDPAAAETGTLASPYAENTAAYRAQCRIPEGADISGLPVDYHGSVALIGDAGYELFGFYAAGARKVAQKVAAGAAAVEGKARVFGIIVPNRMGAVLSYADAKRLCRTEKSEAEAIEFAYEQMGDKVITPDAMSNLRLHNDEYIFFRTDHHWTALGSYYAYEAWAEAAGFEPVPLDQFDTVSQTGHLGYFYASCGKPAAMRNNPDEVIAYVPHSSFTCSPDNAMDFTAGGYNVFLGGDRALTTIVNNDIDDDSACVLVKDSYGNPFAVWLTQHYHTVYVIDYRHYRNTPGYLSFSQFAEQKGVDDFIVLLPMTLSQADLTSSYLAKYCW